MNPKPEQPPFISAELLSWLRARFPDRCPDLEASDREVWAMAGAVRVIRHLETIYKKQEGS